MATLTDCRLLAIDLRGHGETEVEGDEADLSGDTLVEDVKAVVEKVQQDSQDRWGSCDQSGVVLVGHSMGGALAARLAETGVDGLAGLVVVDVVEGTALDALAGMQAVLRYEQINVRSTTDNRTKGPDQQSLPLWSRRLSGV